MPSIEEMNAHFASKESVSELRREVADYRLELSRSESLTKERIHLIEMRAMETTTTLGNEAQKTGLFRRMEEIKGLVEQGMGKMDELKKAVDQKQIADAALSAAEESKKTTLQTVWAVLSNPFVVSIGTALIVFLLRNKITIP